MPDPRNAFSINSTTGVIAVRNSTLLDFENPRAKMFHFQVCFLFYHSLMSKTFNFEMLDTIAAFSSHKIGEN